MPSHVADAAPPTPAASPSSASGGAGGPGDMLSHFRHLTTDQKIQRIAAEYTQLQRLDHVPPEAVDAVFLTALSPEQKHKNRYCDVLANERTLYPPHESGKYINGNLLAGSKFGGAPLDFVACQAPLPKNIGEFLEVIAASKTPLIVNLTKNVEGGRPKANQYWPDTVGKTTRFQNASITLVSEDPAATSPVVDTTLRVLRIEPGGHEVTMAHYEGWPDMGVPSTADGVRSIVDYMERLSNPAGAPVFVHCSAGIGRTGTLVGSYFARKMLRAGTLADNSISTIVAGLKSARCGMVQRREQFAFIYQFVLEDMNNLSLFESSRKSARHESSSAAADDDDDDLEV